MALRYHHRVSSFIDQDVRRLAGLARIELTDEEVAALGPQLAQILDFVRQIQAVDTTGVEAAPAAAGTPLRDDVVQPSLGRDEALSQAAGADAAAGLFKVPRVLHD